MLLTFAAERNMIFHTHHPYQSAIKAAVKRLLSDTKIKENAEEIARSFHRCTGPIAAADKIEQVIKET